MAYYSNDLVEDVLAQTDIVSLIGSYVQLRKEGSNFKGNCPFHHEKTPSFMVSPSKQIFKCFGCGVGGNALTFISKIENLDFKDALEELAERAQIDLKQYEIKSDNGNVNTASIRDKKERLYELNKVAARAFYDSLTKVKRPEIEEYLKKRNLDANICAKFGIGYGTCLKPLHDILLENGFTEQEILESDLVGKRKDSTYYEVFTGRLIFPIFDSRGKVIAFGGRYLKNDPEKKHAKYRNSKENIVYLKRKNLYALNIAKKSDEDFILLVEGYMDVVSPHKFGFTNTVASLGTALTKEQARLIKTHNKDTVIIGYDQDYAGKKATLRAIEICKEVGLNVKILRLDEKDAKDPDEYLNKYGKERFAKCLKKAQSYIEFEIEMATSSVVDKESQEGKIEILKRIVNILSKVDSEIERELYCENISKIYKVSEGAILNEINKKNKVKIESKEEKENLKRKLPKVQNKTLLIRNRMEQYIIWLIFAKNFEIYKRLKENILPQDIKNSIIKELYIKLLEKVNKDNIETINAVSCFDAEEEINTVTEILMLDADKCLLNKLCDDVIKFFVKDRYVQRKDEILQRLKSDISQDEKEFLGVELMVIIKEINKLK